ncbi:MAG: hypothetical protein FD166_2939 [Bacteroidetes bacterium]|nr:MAG: hypothetical protein FD166_2939 [Bacteroidota bacterium]
MRLKPEIIQLIRDRRDLKRALMASLDVTRTRLFYILAENKEDGPLTRIKTGLIISGNLNRDLETLYEGQPTMEDVSK